MASQLVLKPAFMSTRAQSFVIAVDARMGEVYWAKYQTASNQLPQRQGDIHLTSPQLVQLNNVEFLAGSAIREFGDRLFSSIQDPFTSSQLDPDIGVDAQGVLACAHDMWRKGMQQDIHLLEPLYIRNKVALTSAERSQQHG
jgi:tRNA threonylcarbamoyladenosine biosynthesis protein TsaB